MLFLIGIWGLLERGPPVVEEVAVEGGERIVAAQDRVGSVLQPGTPWTAQVREALLQELRRLPGIERAFVQTERGARGLRVRVWVEEREPYGLVRLSALRPPLWWVDPEGFLVQPVAVEDERALLGWAGLPVVTGPGLSLEETPQGRRIGPARARRLVAEFYALPGRWLAQLARLEVRPFDLVLETRDGRQIYLSLGDLREGLVRARRAIAALERAQIRWRALDLRVEGELVLRP